MDPNGFVIQGRRRNDPTDDYRVRMRYQRYMRRHGGRTPNSVIGRFMLGRLTRTRLHRLATVNRNRTRALRRVAAANTIARAYRGHRRRERARITVASRRFYANAMKLKK